MGIRLSGRPRAGCLLMSTRKRRGVCRLVVSVCEGTSGWGSGGTAGCGAAGSEAERLGDEDDGDPAGGVAVDDQRLGEHASGAAGALHTGVFARQAVFADAAQAFAEVGDELLVPDDEDDVAGSVGVGAELAARAGAHDDLAGVGDRVRAADNVVGRGAELGYLARLGRPVERRQPGTDRVVASGLVDLGRDAEFTHRLGQGDVDLGAVRDRLEDEPPGFLGTVGDLGQKTAAGQRGSGPFEAGAVGRVLELEVGGARVGKGDAHEAGLLTRSSTVYMWLNYQPLVLHN